MDAAARADRAVATAGREHQSAAAIPPDAGAAGTTRYSNLSASRLIPPTRGNAPTMADRSNIIAVQETIGGFGDRNERTTPARRALSQHDCQSAGPAAPSSAHPPPQPERGCANAPQCGLQCSIDRAPLASPLLSYHRYSVESATTPCQADCVIGLSLALPCRRFHARSALISQCCVRKRLALKPSPIAV